MKCSECSSEITFHRVVEPYDPNLPGVVVDGIERGTCASCGKDYRAVTRLRELLRLVVCSVLNKPWRLAPAEVRWLRLSMNLKAEELGHKFNVTASHISRWETGAAAISALADRLLRMVAASFHNVDPPNLESIDSERSEPLALRFTLTAEGWRAGERKRAKASPRTQPATRQSAYKSKPRTGGGSKESLPNVKGGELVVRGRDGALKLPSGELLKAEPESKRGKIA
jgi:DNA-binding transcriptional regulator YiaG